ncbi:hypothetical protein K466DRAFT_562484 [Polyporus arcularius HHB13444]|uniref:Uncharacterized protein n=1 Tax=Polyporus arcularius HHB13444 TaxID=1314778 RepID=A0A5C3Q0U5_9APHY|nr:hypothetical protein K466DRAFT_562484 [Polyporus arcularius HHB13444]
MSLANDSYHIMTLEGRHAIGRNFVEDKSLLPKRILTVPIQGLRAPMSTLIWDIEPIGDGNYKIKTRGSYVGVLPDGHIFAFVLEEMIQGAEWTIQHVPQHGEDAYIILQKNRERGWSYKEEDYGQLSVNHVICTPSVPPHYMPNMIFIITPA